MAKKTNEQHLGSGLAAIFGDDVVNVLDEIQNNASNEKYAGRTLLLNVDEIRVNPYQPRKVFNDESLKELSESIKIQGVFQPIIVRKASNGYELISGERRLRASKLANKTEIPAVLMEFNDQQMMEVALLENIQREDLNVLEEANAYQKLIDTYNYTQEQLAQRIGKSREHVTNTLRLMKLPKEVQQYVADKKLSMGHVRPLITLSSERAKQIAEIAVKDGLSVRAVEALASEKQVAPVTATKDKVTNPFLKDIEKNIQSKLQTKVKVSESDIKISYKSQEDLNRILEVLNLIER